MAELENAKKVVIGPVQTDRDKELALTKLETGVNEGIRTLNELIRRIREEEDV